MTTDKHALHMTGVAVVIPAHNEAARLQACLNHVRQAADHAERIQPGLVVKVVLVLDRCTDGSEQIAAACAAADSRLSVLPVTHGNVGANRAAGFSLARSLFAATGIQPPQLWLASTDADTLVPADWLTAHLQLAARGADAILGTIEPDRTELGERLYRLWEADYNRVEGHQHIHGANLGVRADAYFAVGGFHALSAHEDVDLVARLRAAGYQVQATGRIHALTSGRLRGRAAHGFADYLAHLDHEQSH